MPEGLEWGVKYKKKAEGMRLWAHSSAGRQLSALQVITDN